MSDVRELTPEFYSCPEFLLNLNNFDFGVTQKNTRVNNVLIPNWAENNPYYFVYMNKKLLESDEVSMDLNNWIDLIFGVNQTGKNAEDKLNVFYYLVYEDQIDLDQDIGDTEREGIETQIVHFGQAPKVIFDEEHEQRFKLAVQMLRKSLNFPDLKLVIYRTSKRMNFKYGTTQKTEVINSYLEYPEAAILKLQSFYFKSPQTGEEIIKIYSIEQNMLKIQNFALNPHALYNPKLPPFTLKKVQNYEINPYSLKSQNFSYSLKDVDFSLKSFNAPIKILMKQNCLIVGGFLSGALKIMPIGSKQQTVSYEHAQTITALEVEDQTERWFI